MKANRLLLLAALGWAALALSPAGAEPPEAAFGEKREVLLDQRGKQDGVTVEVKQSGYLLVNFEKTPGGFSPSGLTPTVAFWQGEKKLQHLPGSPVFRASPGRYQLLVSDRTNSTSSKPVVFRVEFLPEEDPSEPNDRMEQARPVRFGEPVTLRLLPEKDVDLLRLQLEKPGYARLRLKSPAFSLHARAQFLDASGKPESGEGEKFSVRLAAGTHYVKAFSKFDGWSTQPVSLEVSFVPEADPSEPNDTPAAARRIEWDELVPFWILPAGDRDVFRFEAPEAGYAWLNVSPQPGLDLAVTPEWVDEAGKVLASGRWIQKVAKGPALLRLKGRFESMGEESAKPLYASVSFMPEIDPSEPNDTLETARSVALNSVAKFQLIPEGDADLFRFELKEPGLVYGRLGLAPAASSPGDYRVEILDAQGKPAAGLYNWQEHTYASLEPGRYFVKICRTDREEHTGFELVVLQLALVDLKIPMEGIDFTLIGLGVEKDPATIKQLQLIAQAAGGRMALATEAEKLKEEFVKAARKAESRRGPGWLLILLPAAAALLFLALKRKK